MQAMSAALQIELGKTKTETKRPEGWDLMERCARVWASASRLQSPLNSRYGRSLLLCTSFWELEMPALLDACTGACSRAVTNVS